MKKLLFLSILSLIFELTSFNSYAQWQQTNGPYGGSIGCFAINENYIYAGVWSSDGGVYFSSNNGTNWTKTNNGPTCVKSLAISGSNIFAGTCHGVFLSTNNGSSWSAVNTGLPDSTSIWVNSIVISGSNIFAGTNHGIFLSSNNGSSWDSINTGLTSSSVNALAISGNNIFAATNSGVFLSSNNGGTWVHTGLASFNVKALAISGNNIFAATYVGGVFLSSNNGANWTAKNTGLTNTYVESIAISGGNIYVGTMNGVFLSSNNGNNWISIGLTSKVIISLAIKDSNILAGSCCGGGGVLLSSNNGSSWTSVGFASTDINVLAIDGNDIFAGLNTSNPEEGMFLSSNDGNTWTSVNNGLTSPFYYNLSVFSIAISGTNIFAGTYDGVFFSSNSGNSWVAVNTGLKNQTWVPALAINGNNIFAGTNYGIYLSTNNGGNWSAINNGLPDSTWVSAITISGNNIFAGTEYGMYLSTNNGGSWSAINTGIPNNIAIREIAITGSKIFAATSSGVFLSSNNGNSWSAVNTGLTNLNVYALATNGSNIFASVYNGGVFLYSNNGNSWSAVNTGLTNLKVHALATNGNNIFAGLQYGGVWKRSLCDILQPSIAGTISGATIICQGQNNIIYTVPAIDNATSYIWSLPTGAMGTSTTNSIIVNYGISAVSGNITVKGHNSCGDGISSSLPITVNVLPVPIISGFNSVCAGTTGVTYSTEAGMVGYSWNISDGGIITSGLGTNTITVTWNISGMQNVSVNYSNINGCTASAATNHNITINPTPTADAGTDNTFTGIPVLIGNPSNGPGIISWSPSTGLNNTTIARPLASPTVTTTYTLTVNNNGCIATDDVTIFVSTGHNISGKTMYMGRAYNGSPAPNLPTYNPAIYNIDRVIVLLRNYPSGTELARDTSDASGNYQFTDVPDGEYLLSYDKFTADTMQWGNDVNVADVSMLKYLIASDTLLDPSRKYTADYMKAANVDNNLYINVVDVSRIKSKIASPYSAGKNFPKGNWLALDKAVTVSGSDININLETICYGDYNASSSKYRDSSTTWNGLKSTTTDILIESDEYITTVDPAYFEIPLRISTKMNELSALGLELTYPSDGYQLVNVTIHQAVHKTGGLKINPSLDEIIADDNDLLVTDENGVIRVVYATTKCFNVVPNDEIIRLVFRSIKDLNQGELEFKLSGTGIIANQYGEENDEAYLLMPKIFVQGGASEPGFEFTARPNPFGGEATINYAIPENGNVKIMVYNALGELVSELVNCNQAGGRHTVLFSADNPPSGVYTFKLEYLGSEKSKCLILKLLH